MKRIYLYTILLFASIACHKIEPPDPQHPQPVFTAKFETNGVEQTYKVGEDSLKIVPSFYVDKHRVPVFTSSIEYENCQTGSCEKLLFKFNGEKLYNKDQFNFEEYFHKGRWDYQWKFEDKSVESIILTDKNTQGIRLLERWRNKANDLTIKDWEDVPRSQRRRFSFDRDVPASFELCRDVRNSSIPAVFTSCKRVYVQDAGKKNDSLRVSIQIEDVNRDFYTLKAIVHGVKKKDLRNLKFHWNLTGDNTKSTLKVKNLAKKEITVVVADPTTNQKVYASIRSELEFTKGSIDKLPRSSDFYISRFIRKVNPDLKQLGKVSLLYTNKSGKLFSSSAYKQSPFSYFKVLAIADYAEENSDKLYKKIKVEFSSRLYSRQGEMEITNGHADIVVGLPER